MQTSKYLLASERDAQWGLTISTIGYEVIEPHDSYPTKGHADGYYFDINKGRTLDEFQLLYLTEGEGVFQSDHCPETVIKAGDIFLLFPGEWHTYHPTQGKGWKSYWIGFKGRNIDDRVKHNFLSPEKPIYHVGFSNEIVNLYTRPACGRCHDRSVERCPETKPGTDTGRCTGHRTRRTIRQYRTRM